MPRSHAFIGGAFLSLLVAGSSVGGCGEDDVPFPTPPDDDPANQPFVPAEGGVRRLLSHQYLNAVKYLLGDEAAERAEQFALVPVDNPVNGYLAIGAAETPLGLADPELYDLTSAEIGSVVANDATALATHVPCIGSGPFDDACYADFAEDFGRLAFRRPVTSEEKTWIVDLAKDAQEWDGGEFMTGISYALRAILQSPNFLYIVEIGDIDPDHEGWMRLTDHEVATRLAFFLTDNTPDAELLDAADAGELQDEANIRTHAQRLLKTAEAKQMIRTRFGEFLYLQEVLSAQKSGELFPEFSEDIRLAMVEEVERLLADIVWTRDADIRDLYSADYTFVNSDLAEIYGVQSPGQEGAFAKATWPASEGRAGFLSTGAFLARASHSVTTSPTRRGVFIKDRVLCEIVPPPDPDVTPVLKQPEPGDDPQTTKQLVEQHLTEDRCRNCHLLFDPYGFAFEHFDAIGQYRTKDNGLPIDSAGEISNFGEFNSPRGIADLLLEDEKQRVTFCIILNVLRGSLGHLETDGEAPALAELHSAFEAGGFRLQDLLVEMTVNNAFLYVAEESP